MSNPVADYPTIVHIPTDISAFADDALGITTPTHGDVHGKLESEIVALQEKLGIGDSDASGASDGQVMTRQADGSTAWETPSGGPGGGGTVPVYVVAALGASSKWQDAADYTCDGTADDVQIQAAYDQAMADGGGVVWLSPGLFTMAATLVFNGTDDVDAGASVIVKGSGSFATYIDGEAGSDVIAIGEVAILELESFSIAIHGTADGITSTASAGVAAVHRSFWNSRFANLYIISDYSSHVGWAMLLGSPFRSTFENIEIGGTENGIKLFSEFSDFNPGDCTFNRVFIDLAAAGAGVAYHLNGPSGKGIMNQCTFIQCEAIASVAGSTGIKLDGTVGASWNTFIGTNLEQFTTAIDVVVGEGNTFKCNYVEVVSAGTIFKAQAGACNNRFSSVYIYSASTQTVLNDANTANTAAPNRLIDTHLYADTGSNMGLTILTGTILRDNTYGGGGTVNSNFTKNRLGDAEVTALKVASITGLLKAASGVVSAATAGTDYYAPGSTDVALADGGTGASLTDPNADRIMFWDDSAGSVAFLTPSTGLTITTTNITVNTASDTVSGIVELATAAETTTGTDAARAVTPDGLAGSDYGKRIIGVLVAEVGGTAITTGDGKAQFRIPSALNGYNLVAVSGNLSTVSSSGIPTVQIRRNRRTNATTRADADMLSTKLTIDASEFDSVDAAAAAVIDAANDDVVTGDAIYIDIDVAGTGAKGLYVELTFQLP